MVTRKAQDEALVKAVYDNFTSPNVADSNCEAATLVDTTHDIAKALWAIARALEKLAAQRGEED
jgi:hypothetical protein